MIAKGIVLLMVLIGLSAGLYSISCSAENDNSQVLQLAAASLNDQMTSCGPSLEIEYTRVLERTGQAGKLLERGEKHYHYIRTPEAQRVDTLVDGEVVHKAFHNTINNEWRDLSIDDVGCVATEGHGIGEPFLDWHFFETSLYRLEKKPLVEWIPNANIVGAKEVVDGHECLRLHIKNTVPRPSGFEVWLDPAIGYNPRRIDIIVRDGDTTTLKYEGYEPITENVWFPKKLTMEFTFLKENWNIKVTNTVTKINVGKTYAVDQLRPMIPSGTEVYASGGKYIQR